MQTGDTTATRQRIGVEHAALAVHHQGRVRKRVDNIARRDPGTLRCGRLRLGKRRRWSATVERPHDADQWTGGLRCCRITRFV